MITANATTVNIVILLVFILDYLKMLARLSNYPHRNNNWDNCEHNKSKHNKTWYCVPMFSAQNNLEQQTEYNSNSEDKQLNNSYNLAW